MIILDVPSAPEAVMVDGNGFPYRVGDSVVREPQEVINDRKTAYRRVGYERRINPEASIADLDLDLAARFLSNTVHKDRHVLETMQLYGLIARKGGDYAVSNAALLLFGASPLARWHPRTGIRFFRVRGKSRVDGARRNVTQLHRFELPIASLIPETHNYAATQIGRSERLHNLFFREMKEYPTFAWQEAIVNAIAHRDYADQGREVEVWFYDDRMEVISPGDLVPPVTLQRLLERRRIHASRNPLIVRVLVDARIMREEGEGIPRMYEEMEESFLAPPEFLVEDSSFGVVLRNEPIFVGPSAEWQRIIGQLPLSVAQRRALLAQPQGFTNEDYRRLNEVDRDEAYRQIQEMISMGVVVSPDLPGRGAKYRISPELHSARVLLEGRVPGVKLHLKTHGSISNTEYRRLFGLTRYTAARELRRLVEERYLVMVGKKRGARYVRGPSIVLDGADL